MFLLQAQGSVPRRSGKWAPLLALSMLLVILSGCSTGNTGDTSPTSIKMQWSTWKPGLPDLAWKAPVSGTLPADQVLHIEVTFKIDQAALEQMGKGKIAQAGESVSAADIASKVGISDQDYQQIKAFFSGENVTISLDSTRTVMTIEAKASVIAQKLQTKFVVHKIDNRTFFAPDLNQLPKIPTAIAEKIQAVTGLDNYSLPLQPLAQFTPLRGEIQQLQRAQGCQTRPGLVSPEVVARAYGFDQLWKAGWRGENMTINLVEIDGFNQSDVDHYGACVGAQNQIKTVTVGKKAPAPGGEATLDIEMIQGLAPRANIVVYQTANATVQGINQVLRQIIVDNAGKTRDAGRLVSISLGQAEQLLTADDMRAMSQSIQILTNSLHMSVFVASGDCGAYGMRIYGLRSVSFPASAPHAVAVGGTTMLLGKDGTRADEIVWSDGSQPVYCHNQWGSGGGLSVQFKQPEWQVGDGVRNKYSTGMRQLPDIAAIADNLPVYFQGKWIGVGGTSAATPIWAAGMALVNQGLIAQRDLFWYAPDTFYTAIASASNRQPYYDVTKGNNLYYNATAHWDYTTGWGTPVLPAFYRVLYDNSQM
ncbi:MAG: S8 family serine peptidase [Ktedonobacteraceae bacterium]|nr:S8 family serine peptidase [Ktedonobacteraceae bacterium]